jgi:Flp pilus assembly protein CpaB
MRSTALAWADWRMLAGVALIALSVSGGLLFWSATRETVPVLIAETALPPGHVISAEDLTIAQVKLDGRLASLAIPEAERSAVIGRVVGKDVHAGAMLLRPDLASRPVLGSGEVAMTVPVQAEAVYSRLRPGDRVAVLATRDKDKPTSQTVTLLERAVVYEVSLEPSRLSVGRASDGEEMRGLTNVTLVVPRAEAERLAHAVVNWELTLALLPPAGSP